MTAEGRAKRGRAGDAGCWPPERRRLGELQTSHSTVGQGLELCRRQLRPCGGSSGSRKLHQSQDRPVMLITDGASAYVLASSAPRHPNAKCACARAC